jgi:hypothetical protein
MTASAGARHGIRPVAHRLECSQRRQVKVQALAAPLAGPPIVARRRAPGEGTGSRPWGSTKGVTER